MNLHFYKFHGNGNDFIIFDNRANNITLNVSQIKKLCNRRLGIGADGLILLSASLKSDFEMVYYNSDGNISSMCGNGGRCITAFAYMLGNTKKEMIFDAYDGTHKAIIESETISGIEWDISLQLADVIDIDKNDKYYFLDTGSPHYVEFVDNVADINVSTEGKKIRDSKLFAPDGTNVNFIEIDNNQIFVRTYERGVEEETLSCGTGVTASAIAVFLENGEKEISIHTKGGIFIVNLEYDNNKFSNIWLRGPARLVFEGDIII